MGTMSVPSRTLCLTLEVVNGDILLFDFWTEIDWSQNSYYGNNIKGVICFYCDGHLWCQVSRTLL